MNANLVSLEGKVAVVTGAGVGMGAATARLLAARGAKVIVSDINADTAAATVAAIRAEGGTAHAVRTDVADEAQVEALIAETVATFGRFDCAGTTPRSRPMSCRSMRLTWPCSTRSSMSICAQSCCA